MICILYWGGGVVSPRSAQLHLGSGVVVVKRRERIEYCTAGRCFSGLPCYPFTMLNIFFTPNKTVVLCYWSAMLHTLTLYNSFLSQGHL